MVHRTARSGCYIVGPRGRTGDRGTSGAHVAEDEQLKGDDEPLTLKVAYVDTDDPMIFANQFVVQIEQDELILTFGQLVPPMIVGPRETWAEQARTIPFVPVRVRGRYGMSMQRARDLHRLLGEQIAKYEQAKGETPG